MTGAVAKKKSVKSSKIHDQLELERLKQQNLQLKLKLLSQKEKLGTGALQTTQDKTSADARGQLLHDHSQEKVLASLMNELTPPSREDQNQLANPTFRLCSSSKQVLKATLFSPPKVRSRYLESNRCHSSSIEYFL